ncbi:alpha-1,2-fucosyltransferase [Priestia megaterium]|uniref:alpha-1,2-fucosyltransferase n=1 Tax=Priestia megaterium TaxID=1404 RepID=UPI002FFF0365
MIIVRIKGGLGNQLFTYAFGYAIARKKKCDLILDKSLYFKGYFRPCEIDNFELEFNKSLIPRFFKHPNIVCKLLFKAYYKALRLVCLDRITYREKQNYVFDKNIYKTSQKVLFDGYWQNYRYFHDYREEIRDQFKRSLPNSKQIKLIKKQIVGQNAVALHIRRGDYKAYKGGKCLALDYYFDGIKYIKDKIEAPRFYVFSDDVAFCKEHFNSGEFIYVGEKYDLTDIEEFSVMSSFNNFIIANSSYSWWAAYLGECKDSVIMAPVVDQWKQDFYPETWKTIDTNLE